MLENRSFFLNIQRIHLKQNLNLLLEWSLQLNQLLSMMVLR